LAVVSALVSESLLPPMVSGPTVAFRDPDTSMFESALSATPAM